MQDDLWSDADIIDTYTRRQAIEDGVLVQLSGPGYQGDPWVPEMVAEAGFRYPVAMTATAFCSYVSPLEGDDERLAPLPRHQGPPVGRAVDAQGGNPAHPGPARHSALQPASGAQCPVKLFQAQPAKAQDRASQGRVRAGRRRLAVSDDHAARGGLSTMLTFPKRPRRDQTIAADRKLWTSKCRQYRVAFSRCRYGPHDERGIPDVCYAQHFDQELGVWDVLSRHRSRNAAARACQRHARMANCPKRRKRGQGTAGGKGLDVGPVLN